MADKLNHSPFTDILEHDDTTAPETKRVLLYGWDPNNLQKVRLASTQNGKLDVNASIDTTGLATEAKQTQPGVDIGDVTINNTTINPVPVQPPASGYLTVALDQTGTHNDVNVTSSTLPTGASTSANQDALQKYRAADVDDDATPNYYGFIDADGNWYILKEVLSAGANTYRYIAGSSNYTTNWTNRASLSYDYFYNIF